ncbi:HAMP domain-containing sensor histidine kinase [Mangrovivirga sp. M17]|uniref:histidine kinase n=1 Tax=Mangrovivirga halotolerans TaxID=2993936 RepID=A0ABT3RPV7_9BACT|nr:HAMP domain-containing sensor histidine kinase [Mangrovivirga halotolerans]MCX2743822.1 HAMP domain-containing sensor histidine kinase [Mangrovivirga halotolerans]
MLSVIIKQSVSGIENQFERTRIVATIYIALILIILCFLLFVSCLIYQVINMAILNAIVIIVSLVTIYLCRIHKGNIAKNLLLATLIPLVVLGIHLAFNDLRFTDTENFLFVVMVVAVFLLDGIIEKIVSTITVIFFIYFKHLKYTLKPEDFNSPEFLLIINSIGVIVISYLVMILLKKLLESIIIKLNKANEDQNRLINIISHDIRSPIRTFEALLDAYLKGYITEKELLENSESIKTKITPLKDMIDELLYWSLNQLKGLKCNPSKIDLEEELDKLLIQLKPESTAKNIEIVKELNQKDVYADPNHFKIIARNIIHNSIKYSPENSTIKLISNADEKSTSLIVSDEGKGMSEEQICKIMNQDISVLTKGTKGEVGKGVGLTFCIHLLKLNKGEVNIKSVVNEGTRFQIDLPNR